MNESRAMNEKPIEPCPILTVEEARDATKRWATRKSKLPEWTVKSFAVELDKSVNYPLNSELTINEQKYRVVGQKFPVGELVEIEVQPVEPLPDWAEV